MLSLQVLVATMNEESPVALYKKMNLCSDALIINQRDFVAYEDHIINNHKCECYTFNEKGLSRSRNNALMRATADIVCLADDDMVYSATYVTDIINEFEKHPEADAIIFYVEAINGNRRTESIKRFEKMSWWEYKDYSSVNIAIRREKIVLNNIWFNIAFGSGSLFNCGEDTIFLKDVLKKKFKVYKAPIKIAEVDMSESSWFKGYNEKHFYTKGALLAAAYPLLCYPLSPFLAIKNSKKKVGNIFKTPKVLGWYLSGIRDYKRRI